MYHVLYFRYFIYFCIVYICKIHSTFLDLKIAYKYINVCNRLIKLLPTIFKDAFPDRRSDSRVTSIPRKRVRISLGKPEELIFHCAFSFYRRAHTSDSFFTLLCSSFYQDSQRPKYLVLNSTELFSGHIGDRWSLGSNKSPVFFHPRARPLSSFHCWFICTPLFLSFSLSLYP